MVTTGEVKVITARSFANIVISDGINTVADAVKEAGLNPSDCTVRVDSELVTNPAERPISAGMTITAFKTATVASAGVKGGSKGS